MTRVTKLVFFLIVISFSAGCANKYKIDSIQTPISNISENSHFYVMLPQDGRLAQIVYAGSGRMASSAVSSVLQKNRAKITQASTFQNLSKALAKSASVGSDYIFQTTILHWEDRATEWSGKSDKITMKYIIIDVGSGEEIASTVVSASSKWATLGGDHPQDLLPQTVQDFIDSVFK